MDAVVGGVGSKPVPMMELLRNLSGICDGAVAGVGGHLAFFVSACICIFLHEEALT